MGMFSFAILCRNETDRLSDILDFLSQHMHDGEEIIVLDDFSAPATTDILRHYEEHIGPRFRWAQRAVEGDFSGQRNHLKSLCRNPYLFYIDADEIPDARLMGKIRQQITERPKYDIFAVPRINIVDGLSEQDRIELGWSINEKGWLNFPDFQGRILRNSETVYWDGKVHEKPRGDYMLFLPEAESWAIWHKKDADMLKARLKTFGRIKRGQAAPSKPV